MEGKRNSPLTIKVNVPKLNPQNENVNILNNRGNGRPSRSVVHKTGLTPVPPQVPPCEHWRTAGTLEV